MTRINSVDKQNLKSG